MMKRLGAIARFIVPLVCILLMGTQWLAAQSLNGSVSGLVTDQSKSAVPGATINLKSIATGTLVSTSSGPAGLYSFPNVLPGTYDLTVSAKGFSRFAQRGITVYSSQHVNVNAVLRVGAIQQSVVVNANASPLNYQNGTQGGTVPPRVIQNLPLLVSGGPRDAASFVALLPGVTQQANNGDPTSIRINGGEGFSDEATWDGVSITGGLQTQNGIGQTNQSNGHYISVEAVKEVSELTSNYDPRFGSTTSGVFIAVTKNGTNQFHGSLYEYAHNAALNARTYGQPTRPGDVENDFGGNVGGPLNFIPGLRHVLMGGKRKTYFFVNYERYFHRGGLSNDIMTLPTIQERQGDFSDWVNSSGNMIPIYNPSTTVTYPNGTFTRQPFLGNIIPPADLNPLAQGWLKYLPAPNLPGIVNNYITSRPPVAGTGDTTLLDARVDFYYGEKDHFTGTGHYADYSGPIISALPPQLDTGIPFTEPAYTIHDTLSWDHTFTPRLVNTVNLGYNLTLEGWTPIDAGYASSVPQIAGAVNHNMPPMLGFGDNYAGFGQNQYGHEWEPNVIVNDRAMWTWGKHLFELGGGYRGFETNLGGRDSIGSGALSFNDLSTGLQGVVSGNSMASFLLGQVASAYMVDATVSTVYARAKYWYLYAGDTWKVTPKLTVDYGVRWDVSTPVKEKYDHMSFIDPHVANPDAGGRLGAMVFAGNAAGPASLGRSTPNQTWYGGFAPRLGFAYAITPKTVIRGGYGMFYAPIPYLNGSSGVASNLAGFNAEPSFGSPVNGEPAFLLQNGFPSNWAKPPFLSLGFETGTSPADAYQSFGPLQPPVSAQWNFTVEHQFTNNFYISTAYVGNRAYHLASFWSALNVLNPSLLSMGNSLNAVFQPSQTSLDGVSIPYTGWVQQMTGCAPTVAQALLPYPQYCGSLAEGPQDNGYSTFNSFQLKVEKRYSHGLWLLGSYMWSKWLNTGDMQSGGVTQGYGVSPYEQNRAYTLSADDVPNSFTGTVLYDLPFGRGKHFLNRGGTLNKLVGGWQVSTIYRVQSGTPLIFNSSVCNVPTQFAMPCYPGVLPGANVLAQPENHSFNPNKPLFNVAAFQSANSMNFYSGAASQRSSIRGFGYEDEDVSVTKKVPLLERLQLDFGAQLINVWNWHSFTGDNQFNGQPFYTNVGNPSNFGMWTGEVTQPRNIQLFARLSF